MHSDFTLGAEEEYQLVDPETGELRSDARDVLETDWSDEVTQEIHQTQVEVGTHVCTSAEELRGEIARLRMQTASAAAAGELAIVAAALHPFSRWEPHRSSAGARYRRLLDRFGRILRTEHVFGMHVHVALPDGVGRVAVSNALRGFAPHLIALSASSPIYEGEDTRFDSYRSILVGRLAHSGPAPRFADEAEHRRYTRFVLDAGAAIDQWTFYWTLRLHPRYPTLEFRAADVCPRVEDAVAIAALCRAMVAAAAEGRLREPASAFSGSAVDAALRANEWLAARFGLEATLLDPVAPAGVLLRDAVRRLLDVVGPVGEALGDAAALARIPRILEEGNAASRIREMKEECGSLPELVRWLARESLVGTGMDRRREQRFHCD
jgi:carboxylate-amine ligase